MRARSSAATTPRGWRSASSQTASTCARSRRWCRAAAKSAGGGSVARTPRDKDPDTKAFEKELADLLGLKVEIKRGSGESGNLVIKFGNFDQLDYIRQRLGGG